MRVTNLTIVTESFDEAAVQAVITRAPVAYTMRGTDLPDDDLRLAGKQVCIWPDGQLDVVGEA